MTASRKKGRGGANPRYAKSSARVKLRRRVMAEGRGCWICRAFGRPDAIDYSLPARHPRSFELDELVPISKGGSPIDYGNVDATHRECNNWRGNRSVAQVLAIAREFRGGGGGQSDGDGKTSGQVESPKDEKCTSRAW